MVKWTGLLSRQTFSGLTSRRLGVMPRRALLVVGIALVGCSAGIDEPLDQDEPVAATSDALILPCTPPSTLQCLTPPPGSSVKIACICVPPAPPPAKSFTVVPDFYVTHVIYAPPGKSSSIEYSKTSTVGTTVSSSNGFKSEYSVTATAGGGLLGLDAEVSVTGGTEFGTTRSDSVDVSTTYTNGLSKNGQVDVIDHNYDEIMILMKPRLDVIVQPPGQVSTQKGSVKWKFGTQDTSHGIPMRLYAGWLNNAMQMPSNVRSTLSFFGITSDKYAKILAADPLFTGVTPNMTMDSARFEPVGTFPYVPPFAAGDEPSKQTYSVEHSTTNTRGMESSRDYSVGLSVEGSADFAVLKASLKVEGSWTWSNTYGLDSTMGSGSTDSFTLGQPEFGYTGPTLVRVYVDKVFKTYAFTLDYPQGETNLALGGWAWQSSDLPGYEAYAYRANDGNPDGNFWNGSVTHTDAGFTGWGGEGWPGQYWAVDLGAEKVVNSLRIFNRTDCCSERLSHYNILAWSSSGSAWEVIADHSADSTAGVGFLNLPVNMVRTQYVMVAKTDDDYLHLAEVQVMGF
jgi:hypothetical protein